MNNFLFKFLLYPAYPVRYLYSLSNFETAGIGLDIQYRASIHGIKPHYSQYISFVFYKFDNRCQYRIRAYRALGSENTGERKILPSHGVYPGQRSLFYWTEMSPVKHQQMGKSVCCCSFIFPVFSCQLRFPQLSSQLVTSFRLLTMPTCFSCIIRSLSPAELSCFSDIRFTPVYYLTKHILFNGMGTPIATPSLVK
jgi:hypothetical protein